MAIKFCMFILTHGRPDSLYTLRMLEKAGYTGDWYLVIDDQDKAGPAYKEQYGDKVLEFSKQEIVKTFDPGDNFNKFNTIVYARNACFDFAEKMGYTHFMELDDDYNAFSFRFNEKGEFKNRPVRNFDFIIQAMIRYFEKSGASCLAVAQGGDFVGGSESPLGQNLFIKRKAMNTLLCSVERRFQFFGTINEDVNTYTRLGSVGKLFMTINFLSINQKATQSNEGGMTDIYLENGTFVKSFYTVMYSPSSVRIARMGNKDRRIHHKVRWNNTTPMILNERYKK